MCVRSGSYQSRLDALPHLNFNLANVAYAMGRAPYALGGLSCLYLAEDLFFSFSFFSSLVDFIPQEEMLIMGGGDADASIDPRAVRHCGHVYDPSTNDPLIYIKHSGVTGTISGKTDNRNSQLDRDGQGFFLHAGKNTDNTGT